MIIKLAILTRHIRHADRTVSITFRTNIEQSSEELKTLDIMFQQSCLVAIKPEDSPFLDKELSDLDSVDMDLEDTTKTPSKRLRDVLWHLWDQYECEESWKEFYKTKMELLITQIKNRLE